jgi:hypothetical protein
VKREVVELGAVDGDAMVIADRTVDLGREMALLASQLASYTLALPFSKAGCECC